MSYTPRPHANQNMEVMRSFAHSVFEDELVKAAGKFYRRGDIPVEELCELGFVLPVAQSAILKVWKADYHAIWHLFKAREVSKLRHDQPYILHRPNEQLHSWFEGNFN